MIVTDIFLHCADHKCLSHLKYVSKTLFNILVQLLNKY